MTHFTPGGDLDDFVAYRAGAWYAEDTGSNQNSLAAVVANFLYAVPIFIRRPALIDALGFTVGVSVAGVLARCAIYGSRLDAPAPGPLLFGGATDLDCNAAANTALVQTLGTPLRVSRGVLWLIANFNGAARPYLYNGPTIAGTMATPQGRIIGAGSLNAATGAASDPGNAHMAVNAPHTFGTAFPAAFPTPIYGPHFGPIMGWRHG